MSDTVILYRPIGPEEIALVKESGFRRWPPRLPEKPIFYPVTNERYAVADCARLECQGKRVRLRHSLHVKASFMDRYPIPQIGGSGHTEWWVPAEELEELNENIVGLIEVIHEFRT